MSNALKAIIGVTLAVILVCAGFVGGYAVARFAPGAAALAVPADDGSSTGDNVEEVEQILKARALVPPTEASATVGALNGLFEGIGDKHGMYFDEKHYGFFQETNAGEFGGIGVTLGDGDSGTYVVEVFEGTPAAKAGIKPGDIFKTIDGQTRKKWTSDEVVKLVRGKEGTQVKIVMVRPGKKDQPGSEESFTITRAMIEYPNVETEMYGDVGYVRIAQFNAKAADEITAAVEELTKKGAKSLVLDLRDNPGGLLNQAVDVSSLFIDSGIIVRVESRIEDPVEYRTTLDKLTDLPLIVLINGNSASASEIVGGALQDYGRAKLVGEQSFGKGSVQEIEENLSFGGAIKYTTAHYLTPKKQVIDGKGLKPDVEVKMDAEKQADPKTDTQLQKALAIARGEAK